MDWCARQNIAIDLAENISYNNTQKRGPFWPILLLYEQWVLYYDNIKQSYIDANKMYG